MLVIMKNGEDNMPKCRICDEEISFKNTKSSCYSLRGTCGKCYLKEQRKKRKELGLL
tara:strand:- start:341 stop:511 length:171 start_codon:yes stop_codon:yes gene_type:complete